MTKSKLTPERQNIFCAYAEYLTTLGRGAHNATLGYVLHYLLSGCDISKRGYKKYLASNQAYVSTSKNNRHVLLDFLYFCGVKITCRKKRQVTKALDKRTTLDAKAQDILNGFAAWIEKENAYSPNTTKGYIQGAKDFLKYSTTLSTEAVKGYVTALEEANRAPRTINHHLNSVECLARYLGNNIEVKRIKIPHTLSLENIPTERDVEKLLAYTKEHYEKYYIWLRLLMTTGARCHEFQKFTWDMIAAGHVDLKGKGSKIRRFFFSKKVQEECADYMSRHNLTSSDFVALNKLGDQCSTRGIASAVRIMGEKAGIEKGRCHPHAFRHYFAKMYLRYSKSKDITELADLLGHASIDTTMVYIKRSQQEQQRIFNKNVNW